MATGRFVLLVFIVPSVALGVADPLQSSEAADSAIPVLREMLESDDAASRVESLEALGNSPDNASLQFKFDALFDEDPLVRQRAVENLSGVSAVELTQRLLAVLQTGTMAEVRVVEEVLPLLQPMVEPSLIEVLEKDPDHTRRVLAAYALGCMKAPAAAEALARIVWQDDRVLSMTCVQALGRMRTPETLPYLQSMLGHSSEEIRWEAVHGVGNLQTPEALSALVTVATSGRERSPLIAKQALLYLGYSENADAIPLLIKAMEYSQAMRKVAGEALYHLTGKRFGSNPMGWRRWYEEELASGKSTAQLLRSNQAKEAAQQEQLKVDVEYESFPGLP